MGNYCAVSEYMSEQKNINIRNKRATFDYEILEEYVAGVVLVGTEIKSIRAGRASLTDSFCYFDRGAACGCCRCPTRTRRY